MNKIILLALVTIGLSSFIWVIVAFSNYQRAVKMLLVYSKKAAEYQHKAEYGLSPAIRAEATAAQISHQQNLPTLHELANTYSQNEQATLSDLKKMYLKFGFLYNFFN